MTIDEAKLIPPSTDEFDAAVDAASDLCEAEPTNREAARLLMFLLQVNDDSCMRKLHGRA